MAGTRSRERTATRSDLCAVLRSSIHLQKEDMKKPPFIMAIVTAGVLALAGCAGGSETAATQDLHPLP